MTASVRGNQRTGSPALQTPPVTQQQTLERFYTAITNLYGQINANPALKDRINDSLEGAEFLAAVHRLSGSNGSAEDVQNIQGFLTNHLGMTQIGAADGRVGPRLIQGIQQALPQLQRYQPTAVPIPEPRPQIPQARPSHTQEPVNQQTQFPDRPSTLQPPAQADRVSSPASAPARAQSHEAAGIISDIAAFMTSRSNSDGGYCFSGVKDILRKVGDVARVSQMDPQSREYRQMARHPEMRRILERLRNDPPLAEAVGRGRVHFPPNSVSAFSAADTLGAPDSPYQLSAEGTFESITAQDLRDQRRFPPGSILVWERSPLETQRRQGSPQERRAATAEIARMQERGNWKPGHIHGHVAIIGRDGREHSDLSYNLSPHYARGRYRLYTLR